jgi:hypothetical protein
MPQRLTYVFRPKRNEINNGIGFTRQNLIHSVLRIRVQDPVLCLTPGSGIGFIQIPDPQSIILRA